jgi:ATP-dependent exoDNAse (exonuclease V) alpha subunit
MWNGQTGIAQAVNDDELVFATDCQSVRVPYVPKQFNSEKLPESRDRFGRVPFDYSYAATCHKVQGSEFDHVAVLEQRCSAWEHSRWCYTAATRAKTHLTWIVE